MGRRQRTDHWYAGGDTASWRARHFRPICRDWRAESKKAEMIISGSPSHLVVWPNSTSNAFPVGGIRVPSGRVISPVNVPVARVTTVIQSPAPNWIGYGV